MYNGRVLVQATVTAVLGNHPVYPCCRQCYNKLHHDLHRNSWLCRACQIEHQSDNVSWRYCLNLTIVDGDSACSVAVFGKTLEPFFGVTADKFNSITASLESEGDAETVHRSQEETFVGNSFLFGFKTHASIARLKNNSSSSPITLSQIRHGGKVAKSKTGYHDSNKLVAVLMMSPYLYPLPTVASNIYKLKSHLKHRDLILPLLNIASSILHKDKSETHLKCKDLMSSQNSILGKQDDSIRSQISFNKPEESCSSSTETLCSSRYSSFGQSTLGFSCEESLSKSCNRSSFPSVKKYACEVINGNSILSGSQPAEHSPTSSLLSVSSLGIPERVRNNSDGKLKMSSCYKTSQPACTNVISRSLSNISQSLTHSLKKNKVLENNKHHKNHKDHIIGYTKNKMPLKNGVHSYSKQMLSITQTQNEMLPNSGLHSASRQKVTIASNLNEIPLGNSKSQEDKEVLRRNEMSFENSLNDSSILLAIIPSQPSEHEVSGNQMERSCCFPDVFVRNDPECKTPVKNLVQGIDNNISLCHDSMVSDVFEQVFDDASWLESQCSQSNTLSKGQEHGEIPESDNSDDIKCSSQDLDNVYKNEMEDQHQNFKLCHERESFKVDRQRHSAQDEKKAVQRLLDKFIESVMEDLPESEDLDEFLRKASTLSQTNERDNKELIVSRIEENISDHSTGNYDISVCPSRIPGRNVCKTTEVEIYKTMESHLKSHQKISQNMLINQSTDSVNIGSKMSASNSANCRECSQENDDCNTKNRFNDNFHHTSEATEITTSDLNMVSDSSKLTEPLQQKKGKTKKLWNILQENKPMNADMDSDINVSLEAKFLNDAAKELSKDEQMCTSLKHIQAYVKSEDCNSDVSDFIYPSESSNMQLSPMLNEIENYLPLNGMSQINTRTQIIELLKADCKIQRNQILKELKCHSLGKSSKRAVGKFRKKKVVSSGTLNYLPQTPNKYSKISISEFEDTCTFKSYIKNSGKKMKKKSHTKLSLNETKGNHIGKTSEFCSNGDSLKSKENLFKTKHHAIHRREINKKLNKNLSLTTSSNVSSVSDDVSFVNEDTSDYLVHRLDEAENCDSLQIDSAAEHVYNMDTVSQHTGDDDGADNEINRSNSDVDPNNCDIKKDVSYSILNQNPESESLFSDCNESIFLLNSQNIHTTVVDTPAPNNKECSSHFNFSHSNISCFSSCNGSVDLFDMSDTRKSISQKFTTESTTTRSSRKSVPQDNCRRSTPSKLTSVKNSSKCLGHSCHETACSPDYTKDAHLFTDDYCVCGGNTEDCKCLSYKPIDFDESKVLNVSFVDDSQKENVGDSPELKKVMLSSKSRHVQFSKRLSQVSSVKLMDIRMRLTSSPIYNVHNSSLKSCLKKSETTPLPNSEVPFSQELFSPSPIFNTNMPEKQCTSIGSKCRQPLTSLTCDGNHIESRNKNNNCNSPYSFVMYDQSVCHLSAGSPLLFSESSCVSVTPKRDMKCFQKMISGDMADSPNSICDNDRFLLLSSPDLFSP